MFRHHYLLVSSLLLIAAAAAGCAGSGATPVDRVIIQVPPGTALPIQPTAVPTAAASVAPTDQSAPTTQSAPAASGGDTIKLVIVPEKSSAQYRVREQLASVSLPSDAIGKTSAISGQIVGKPDGTIDSSQSKFVVDLRTLQSDRSQRDGFLRRNTLQSDQYPNAVFVPTSQTGLPVPVPTSGQATFKLMGDLTIRNVTKQVTWDVTCQGQGNEGTCHGSTTFPFEYFNLDQPRVPVVLSVEDHITLEFDLTLQKAGS